MLYRHKQSNEIVKVIQYDGLNTAPIYFFCKSYCMLRLSKGDYVTKTTKNKIDVYSEREFERYFEAIVWIKTKKLKKNK